MTPSNGDLKLEPQGGRARQSPSPRAPDDNVVSAAMRAVAAIVFRVKTPGRDLHDAVGRKDLGGMSRIIRDSPDCVDALNDRGLTPLHVAAQNGQNEIVKLLISEGAEVNARSAWDYTPLTFAAESVRHDVVVTLLDSGADLEAVTKDGFTPLHKAILTKEKNLDRLLVILLISGANCNALNKEGLTALQSAVSAGKVARVRTLCVFGADPSFKNIDGKNAFDCATKLKKNTGRKMVDVLSKWGKCGTQTRKVLRQMLQFIDTSGEVDPSAMLSWASREGQALLVEFILDFVAKNAPHIVETEGLERGTKPIHLAASAGHSTVVEILLAHGATVDARTERAGWTALHLAADKGRHRTLRVLLDNGADLLAMTGQGQRWVPHEDSHTSDSSTGITAFFLAATFNYLESLDVLMQYALLMKDDKSYMAAFCYYEDLRNDIADRIRRKNDWKSACGDDGSMKPDTEGDAANPVLSALPGFDVPGASGSFDGTFYSVPATR